MKRLIVNADDFGLTAGVNIAVIECYRRGAVTSTTLLANGSAAVEAALLAADNPGLGVGLHFNLTAGPPLADPENVPSLLGPDGLFPGLRQALWRLTSGRARGHELELELQAQIERLTGLGVRPTHIDSHHHLHAHPRLRSIVARVCPRHGINRMRGFHMRATGLKELAVSLAARWPAGSAMLHPSRFAGIEAMGGAGTVDALCRALSREGDALEFMCHPGRLDDELRAATSYSEPRAAELDQLLSPEFAAAIEESGSQPISFRAL